MLHIVKLFETKYKQKEKISIVTCYDYTFARILNTTDIDCILVGDSLGMVVQGHDSTLPVTMEDMIYHCRAVKRGAPDKLIICDMPFLSWQVSIEEGIRNAGRLLAETGCHAVKLEGATEDTLKIIHKITAAGIPVMGHLGLTPQSVHTLGGFKVQGKDVDSSNEIFNYANLLKDAGVFSILLEMIPAKLGEKITTNTGVPTIGIGAGAGTSGQVLVIYDLLGLDSGYSPKYLKKFAQLGEEVSTAINQYSKEVKNGQFPSEENSFPES